MSTIIDRIAAAFVGPDVAALPTFVADPILTAGTLLLLEPGANWSAGVPADGSYVPNIARRQAAALGLSADSCLFNRDVEANNGTNGKLERTTKGGLHAILSQASVIPTAKGTSVLFPADVIQYIINNPTHTYGWRMWVDIDRAYGTATGAYVATILSNTGTSDGIGNPPYLGIAQATGTGQKALAISTALTPVNVGANMLTSNRSQAVSMGRRATSDSTLVNLPSFVFYRLVLEDLTVSGRSIAALNAADEALRVAAFSSGGRYFGDTYTAASTLP